MDNRRRLETEITPHREPISPDRAPARTAPEVAPAEPTVEQQMAEIVNIARRAVHNPSLSRNQDKDFPAPDPSPSVPETRLAIHREPTPRRPKRSLEISQGPSLQLRSQEQALLADVGRFRVISVTDLEQYLYPGQPRQLQNDLAYLRDRGLVETHTLNLRRDGKSSSIDQFQAVSLTKSGQMLVERTAMLPDGQKLYHGMVKHREAEHDSQIYRAYRKELQSIERDGGTNPRVRLDYELKSEFNRQVYQLRKQQPNEEMDAIKHQVANDLQLPMRDHRVIVPDARIEYDRPNGMTGQVNIEVVTAAYRHGHIAAKAQAGFKLYMSQGDIGRLGGAVADDHDLMSGVLDL